MAAGDSLRYRARTAVPAGRPETYGSRTMTIHPEELAEEVGPVSSEEENELSTQPVGTLKLRGDGDGQSSGRKVKWDDTVVDNEGLGRKKSKICCIYHKPRAFGESSDEDSSRDDSDDSDHGHDHDHKNGHHPDKCYRNTPNAYERQPQYKNRPRPPIPNPEPRDNPTSPSS
ncbi:hypothetical protein RhiirA5_358235 [Rhizophagus irregularis]|uniref:Type 1 phosphatases regulator n=4 Tax=Rhizophagus irregularis TaxID=588596 RepID=U9TDG9_RHIID|nr:hypothetical protein GLOIN_2v1600100 [Rhizophagus irregularis DAOM 181602=DAOM 197198]EXX63466.1 Ypi1p [Rhizophagus irregularis DAOM 197198w]PKC08206.1 hypothetical protein RhiirA5_358235 [Rhizophagus irregularis]PKC69888.1 hypothetical protein RhiirA1_414977 [Rhizophagus irregularis]PKK68663.1 hypothetical protein RhiirC2_749806 [Rhizophagus irregularis]PKY20243.1 hypothetical protein RhiirB3_407980 [Rhizophagus irregularis]|eukprot:XP_025178941.1 hypothetical protein GLOIN_2v1600100 [Rhizophagus irregularis DAOM 181602=DAOM 197198]